MAEAGETAATIEAALAAARAEVARAEAKLWRMPWPQLGAYLREHATEAGAAHAQSALRVVAERVYPVGGDAAGAAIVLPPLVAVMCAHAGNAAVQTQACRSLINITYGFDAQGRTRKQAAAGAGALPPIVAAMRAHSADAAVQRLACWSLSNITAGANAQGRARKQAAADAGALPQIVAAMRTHAANAAVQEQACRALSNITAGDDAQGRARAQAAADAGALSQIVTAMRAHSANENVQAKGQIARLQLPVQTAAMMHAAKLDSSPPAESRLDQWAAERNIPSTRLR
jgi:hypothetical protein